MTRIRSNLNQTTNIITNTDQYSEFIGKENKLKENISHANNEETNILEDSVIIGLRNFKRLMPGLIDHPKLTSNQRSNTPNNVRTRLNPLNHPSTQNIHRNMDS